MQKLKVKSKSGIAACDAGLMAEILSELRILPILHFDFCILHFDFYPEDPTGLP
jgi:hypothetical protein